MTKSLLHTLTFILLCCTFCCACTPDCPKVVIRSARIPKAGTFTMHDLADISCDSFCVITPYASQALEELPYKIPYKYKAYLLTQTRSDMNNTVLFIANQQVKGYAIVSRGAADFSLFPPGKPFSVHQPLLIDSLQEDGLGRVVPVE